MASRPNGASSVSRTLGKSSRSLVTLTEWIGTHLVEADHRLTENPQIFSEFMRVFIADERQATINAAPHNLDQILKRLLRRKDLDSIFDKDFFFYAVLIHCFMRSDVIYFECGDELIERLIERLKRISSKCLSLIFNNHILSIVSDDQLSDWHGAFVDAFPSVCDKWMSICLKEKRDLSQERYVYVAMMCVTMSLKIVLKQGKVSRRTSKLWQHHLVEPFTKHIVMNEDATHDLSEGLQLLMVLDVPQEHVLTIEHLQLISSTSPDGRCRSFVEAKYILETIINHCQHEYWIPDRFLTGFVKPLRRAYKQRRAIFIGWGSRGGISELLAVAGGTAVSIVESGLQFVLTFYCFFEKKKWISDHTKKECMKWIKILINSVDFCNDPSVQQCIEFFTDERSKIWQNFSAPISQKLNSDFLNCLQSISDVNQFMRIYDTGCKHEYNFWLREVLERFVAISQERLPPEARLSDDGWQRFIKQFQIRYNGQPRTQQDLLLPLLTSFGLHYQKRKQPISLIVHLLKLDTTDLFIVVPSSLSSEKHTRQEPRRFQDFLRNYIHSNNLAKTILHEVDTILECTSLLENLFQSCIISIVLKELLSAKCVVNGMSVKVASSALQVLNEANEQQSGMTLKSPRVWFAVGILHYLSTHIEPSDSNLDWLSAHGQMVKKLAQAYQDMSKMACFKYYASLSDDDLRLYGCHCPQEVLSFFGFILRMKVTLKAWNNRFLAKRLTSFNITDLLNLVRDFNDLSSRLQIEVAIRDEQLESAEKEFRTISEHLKDLLVRSVPGHPELNSCYLKDLLAQHNIDFDPQNRVDVLVLHDGDALVPKEKAYLCDLSTLEYDIKKFLEPISSSSLEALVFFQLKPSNLFKSYLENYLFIMDGVMRPIVQVGSQQTQVMSHLNEAAQSAIDLILRLCDGSATEQEVTLNGNLPLQDIDVENERHILQLFVEVISDEMSSKKLSCSGLRGVTALLELLQMYEDIFTIREVCKQFELTECISDPDLDSIVKIAEELSKTECRATLTMEESIVKLKQVKEVLVLKGKHSQTILKLFKAVLDSKAFFQFAKENGFRGDIGRRKFTQLHNLVTTRLQHEEYNGVVLDHLLGCYDYIDPFLRKSSSLNELMMLVTALPNIENGINQLRTVNGNIGLIKQWFEGESFENVGRTLKSIINTRVICLRAVGTDPVELTLEIDPEAKPGCTADLPCDQQWSHEKVREFCMQVRFMQYELRKQQEMKALNLKDCDINGFLHIFKKSEVLQSSLQQLRELQIRSDMILDLKLRCSNEYLSVIEYYVEEAEKDLQKWLSSTKIHRKQCKWLAFFSNKKLLQVHHLLTKDFYMHAEHIVQEISIIFPNNYPTRASQVTFVKKAIGELKDSDEMVSVVGSARALLNKLMEYDTQYAPRNVTLVKNYTGCDRRGTLHGPLRLRHFTLHYVPEFSHKQQIHLLCDILQDIPLPFQLLRCNNKTTIEEIELFFQRIASFPEHKYVIFDTNTLCSDIQEVLVKRCVHLIETASTQEDSVSLPMLHFTETGHSVLLQMPWILVEEHKDLEKLPSTESVQKYCKSTRERTNFRYFQLVYGRAGDGKTHYIRKELQKGWHDETVIISINECFSSVEVIKVLRGLPLEQRNLAIFINFTLTKPEMKSDMKNKDAGRQEEENRQFWILFSEIHWFFFFLFVVGYIEDQSTGLSFRLPGGLQWSIYVEVPAWCSDAKESLSQFNNVFPAFHYLGKDVPILPETPFDINGDIDVQLVCKYLKAKLEGKLDQWLHRGNSSQMPYLINRIIGDLKVSECQELLRKCLPERVTRRKIIQRLYMKYMERRCQILEACPALQFNEGKGEPILDSDGKCTGRFTDITKLRSLLFKTMEKEVLNFCATNLEISHQQLIYDGAASFKFLSLQPNKISKAEKERFRQAGIVIPPIFGYYKREFLDSCISHALNIPLNEKGCISLIDENHYVMTLDYAVKMLTVHERRKCGIPVIINGETGVGKTFLLEMLSILWNHSVVTALNKARSSLWNMLEVRLQHMCALGKDEFESVRLNSPEEWFGLAKYPVGKVLYTDDDVIEIKKLQVALKESMAVKSNIPFDSLLHVLNLPDPHEPIYRLYQQFCTHLLEKQYDPLFSMIVFPQDMTGDNNIMRLFEQANSKSPPVVLTATTKLLYGLFAGQPKKVFYKLCIHAALTPEKIIKFFDGVIVEAEKIQTWFNFSSKHCSSKASGSVHTPLSLTIFLDEVNTASCPGFIKEIITDRTMNGKKIPSNVFIVAACNPHRANSLASQTDNWFVGSYYVRPFHQTLQLLMWNYGSLSIAQEKEYINSKMMMTEGQLTISDRNFLADQISKSQQLIRTFAEEHLRSKNVSSEIVEVMSKSTVSQRDIQRVFILYNWLKKSFSALGKYIEDDKTVENMNIRLGALFVALAVVYYFRLDAECREKFADEMEKAVPAGHLNHAVHFKEALDEELNWTIDNMKLPPGIAKTQALKENVYATVVCAMTRIPLIIVGQPGSSKTLSFKIVTSNLLGQSSPTTAFRNCEVFKALDPHFYQCSRKSSSIEIEVVFQQAINRQASLHKLSEAKVSVVMMDEAGLPERSHESLKVLHYYLDDQKVAFVGISNHILDAAKMNRAVSLFRPIISQDEVEVLASGCLLAYTTDQMRGRDANYVRGFSRSYLDVMRDANIRVEKFFGLRDFIHFCAYLRRAGGTVTPQLVIDSLERNFNGSNHFDTISRYFQERVFRVGATTDKPMEQGVLAVLKQSLANHPKDLSAENEVRYKLIIDSSKDGSLVRLLFSFNVLKRESTRIYVSSRFLGDAESEKLGTVAAIKHSASQGHTVLLSQTDNIHECFYDLFNQRFTCIEDISHGKRVKRFYANVAIGSYIKPCLVHPHFQCVVIIKDSEIANTPHAFLNRFEKYALTHQLLLKDLLNVLPVSLVNIITTAKSKVCEFLKLCGDLCLYGQNDAILDSLLLAVLPFHLPLPYGDSQLCSKRVNTKVAKLLTSLEFGLQYHFGFKFTMTSTAELHADGVHLLEMFTKEDSAVAVQLEDLTEVDIPDVVNTALFSLKQDRKMALGSNRIVITVLQQWLVIYLCKRLLQLMTPEALVTNCKMLPIHYKDHYLNHQSHFSLKNVINKYHSDLIQEWNCSSGMSSLVPNKLICYCRSSDNLHNIPREASDESRYFLKQCMDSDIEKGEIFKITSLTTQKTLSQHINAFYRKTYVEVLILIANVEDVPLNAVNHIRIMIEECEVVEKPSIPKLFVVLLHFPPRLFFSHCYISYFLHGWDHYYLDTIGADSTTALIDIRKWFSECCADHHQVITIGSFLEAEFLENLLSEALPIVAPHISLKGSMSELTVSKSLNTKINHLRDLLFDRGMKRVFFTHFTSYWKPSVMFAISEQAANLASLLQSTLSITDAINTIVKSNFYDFLLYILSLVNDCQTISIVVNSDVGSPVESLALNILAVYPIPRNLSELKMETVRIDKLCTNQDRLQPLFSFPFFQFVYDKVERLLNQCRRDLATQITIDDAEGGANTTTQSTQEDIRLLMVNHLEMLMKPAENDNLSQKVDTDGDSLCLNAVFVAMACREIWMLYVKDFCTTKLNLGSELFAKSMERTLLTVRESDVRRRVADLHVLVRLYHLDSESLSLMRILDGIQRRYQVVSDEQCDLDLFEKPQKLFVIVVDAVYSVLSILSKYSGQDCVRELKMLSSCYLQMMRLPTVKGAVIRETVASIVKTKWDIIHASMLMLKTEEELDETAAMFVIQFFLYLNMKFFFEVDITKANGQPIQPSTLSSLVEFSVKHLFTCSEDSKKEKLLEGLLEQFFPANVAETYNKQDVFWFLKQLNSDSTIFLRHPSAIRCLKLYFSRILTVKCYTHSSDSVNMLCLFDDKAREDVAKVLLESTTLQKSSFVPDFYLHCDAIIEVSDKSQINSLLANLYFAVTLEYARQKKMELSYLISLIKKISQFLDNKSNLPEDCVVLVLENQVLIHILLEKLACKLRLDNEEIFQLLQFLGDINEILSVPITGDPAGERHGLMLVVHMLRRYQSVHFIHRLMVTHYSDLCRDYTFLCPIHVKLQQQIEAKSQRKLRHQNGFPYKLIHNRRSKEGALYMKIKGVLNVIHNSSEKRHKLLEIVTSCYSVGDGDSFLQKHMFNMALLLCVYYEYYCQNRSSSTMASVLETELKQFLDRGLLNLVLCFVDRQRMQCHPEETAVTEIQEAVDPLYNFFTQSFRGLDEELDPDTLEMQHALVHLVAAVVGTPVEYTNLWYHLFSPEELKGSFVPGFNTNAVCGSDEGAVLYDVATRLSDDGFVSGMKQILHTTRGMINLQSSYFIHWANYGALCISLLMDSTLSARLENEVFSGGLPLRHYCFLRVTHAWHLLCSNTNICLEERVELVNHCLEHYYMKSKTSLECLKGTCTSREKVDECETFLHEQCFVPAWRIVEQNHDNVYKAISTYYCEALRVLDTHYPECATKESFLLQIFSSTSLHNQSCSLYVLYQFILKRPLFNAGGRLLPGLVDFYLWLHEAVAYSVTIEDAQQLTIEVSLSTFLSHYSPAIRDMRLSQFNRIKDLYKSYGDDDKQRLDDNTKLIELLSVADENLNQGNILYNTIIKIVDDFNQFLTSAVKHKSLASMWQYFTNYYTVIPLGEVTMDMCCFGSCLSLDDLTDLMPLICKCCNLERSTPINESSDPSLLRGCVPQVYDLLQLQEDIARRFLAGKHLLQNPSKIYCEFHFRDTDQMAPASDIFCRSSVTDMASLEKLPFMFKDKLDSDILKNVKYQCHSFSYYTLLEVIIGLNSALNQLQKVLHEYRDGQWNELLDKTLAEFLKSRTGSQSREEILKVVGISRFNQTSASVSLRDSQYECLEELKMRHVFNALELFAEWMSVGMFDFCALPFSLKADMEDDDKVKLQSIMKKTEVKAMVAALKDIKTLTGLLIRCEREFAGLTGKKSEAQPIMVVMKDTLELRDEQVNGVVMQHISDKVEVQHYVHLRLELRRLSEQMRDHLPKEKGIGHGSEISWNDWISNTSSKDGENSEEKGRQVHAEKNEVVSTQYTHGFGYKKNNETGFARPAELAAENPMKSLVDATEQQQRIPPTSKDKSNSNIFANLCLLPCNRSKEDRSMLEKLGKRFSEFVDFLESIGLPEVAENVKLDGFEGDIITADDAILDDLGMTPIDRLRFRVLFQRKLLDITPKVAVSFPVEAVVAFFKEKRFLNKCAPAIQKYELDGEMLLLADGEVMEQLGVPAAGVKLIRSQFRELALKAHVDPHD